MNNDSCAELKPQPFFCFPLIAALMFFSSLKNRSCYGITLVMPGPPKLIAYIYDKSLPAQTEPFPTTTYGAVMATLKEDDLRPSVAITEVKKSQTARSTKVMCGLIITGIVVCYLFPVRYLPTAVQCTA